MVKEGKNNSNMVHHLGMEKPTGQEGSHGIKIHKDDKATNPEKTKEIWKKDIQHSVEEFFSIDVSPEHKRQLLNFIIGKFIGGTHKEELLFPSNILLKKLIEIENLGKDSLDFERSLNELGEEVRIFSLEYVEKF